MASDLSPSRTPYGLWAHLAAPPVKRPDAKELTTAPAPEAARIAWGPSLSRLAEGAGGGLGRRRTRYAALSSAAVHALAIVLMVSWVGERSAGLPGPSAGAGIDVTLVSAATLGLAAPHEAPAEANLTVMSPESPSNPVDRDESVGGTDPDNAPHDNSSKPPATAQPNTVSKASTETADTAATLEGAKHGTGATAGGDPSAEDALLAQIARCLPPGEHPRLPAQRLVLVIGPEGKLTAAPTIDSEIPMLTGEARAAADHVVQAALQCGPYPGQSDGGRTVALMVDFSEADRRRPN